MQIKRTGRFFKLDNVLCIKAEQIQSGSFMGIRHLFLLVVTAGVLSLEGVLSLDSAGSSTSKRRSEREVNVLLGVESDNVGWDVDDLNII